MDSQLLEFNRIAKENGKKFQKKRFIFSEISDFKGKHFIGIAGPRGVGKTVILKQLAAENKNSFYISLDILKDEDLYKLVKVINEKLDITIFLLDEIHFNKNYDESLKKIFDFLNVKIIFTSSVSISMFNSSYDLSRRIIVKKLYPFSFREYIFFKYDILLEKLNITDIIKKKFDKKSFEFSDKFEDYLKGDNMPFSLEEPFPVPILKNIINTVIKKDIPSIKNNIEYNEIDKIEKLISFIGKSSIDGINYTTLAKNIGITKYKAKQYVDLLEKAFILLKVMPEGTNVMKEPKILMALPYRLIYKYYKEAIGGIREDFFVESIISSGKNINYLKSTRGSKIPDFIFKENNKKIVVEIGGKGKGRQQFKGVKIKKQLILSHSIEVSGIKRPLFLAGMLY